MRFLILCLLLLCPSFLGAAQLNWLTDLNAAKAVAQKENKTILLDFTGSDWCHWCKVLKSEVFDTPEFADFASKRLVLVEVDFPEHKRLSAQQMQANATLAATYKVEGYPTVILLDSAGKIRGRTGYQEGGPKPYLAALNRMVPVPKAAAQAVSVPLANVPAKLVAQSSSAITNSASSSKANLSGLELKGIMGTDKMRLAVINDHPFLAGEEFKMPLADRTVALKCLEISDKQVKM
ncbi:MAG: thioredoxin-related protein, partial [Verrucomicrobiales bacterium]|nr:thioredoxin-related protein [Verrucomicrobiales bacterium]